MDLRAFIESRIAIDEDRVTRGRAGAEGARFSNSDAYANHLPGIRRAEASARALRDILAAYDEHARIEAAWDRSAERRAARQPGPREAALIAERAQPGDPCTHAINSDCPHFD